MRPVRRWLRDNGLLLANLGLFLAFLVGLALTGAQVHNADRTDHGQPPVPFLSYLGSGDFFEAVFENWESEFLQMGMYVVLTAYLVQRGSSESRPLPEEQDQPEREGDDVEAHRNDPEAPWPVRQGGLWSKLYERSLAGLFFALFAASIIGHAVAGAQSYSDEQVNHGGAPVTVWEYVTTAQFWFESFQNWQSEFLAVALIVGGSIFLRQRGSSESKPVAAPNAETGS